MRFLISLLGMACLAILLLLINGQSVGWLGQLGIVSYLWETGVKPALSWVVYFTVLMSFGYLVLKLILYFIGTRRRFIQCFAYAIPTAARDEILGDLEETLSEMEDNNVNAFAINLLLFLQCLSIFIALKQVKLSDYKRKENAN